MREKPAYEFTPYLACRRSPEITNVSLKCGQVAHQMVLGNVGYPTNGGADMQLEVPWVEDEVQLFTGSFRENVHAFLDRFAVRDASECERGVHGYTIIISSEEGGVVCELRVMVEVVERSKRIHCDQCKCIGECELLALFTQNSNTPQTSVLRLLRRAALRHRDVTGSHRCQ